MPDVPAFAVRLPPHRFVELGFEEKTNLRRVQSDELVDHVPVADRASEQHTAEGLLEGFLKKGVFFHKMVIAESVTLFLV